MQTSCLTNAEGSACVGSRAEGAKLRRAMDLGDMLGPVCARSEAGGKGSSWAELCKNEAGPRCALSVTRGEETRPKRMMPTMGAAKPMRLRLRGGVEGPEWTKSGTSTARPRCAELCREVKGPRCVLSAAGNEDTGPKRAKPTTGATEPARAKARMGVGGSTCARSKMSAKSPKRAELRGDVVEPKAAAPATDIKAAALEQPSTGTLESSLAGSLKGIREPTEVWSKVGMAGLGWAGLREGNVEPRMALSITGREDTKPTQAMPKVDTARSALARLLRGGGELSLAGSGADTTRPKRVELRVDEVRSSTALSMTDREERLP